MQYHLSWSGGTWIRADADSPNKAREGCPPNCSSKIPWKEDFMKIRQQIVATAVGGMLCLATNACLSAAESWSPMTVKPLMSVSLYAGPKHIVGYFLSADNRCKLTLMIAERSDEEKDSSAQASRIQVAVDVGATARLDTGEGKALQFLCEQGAQAMTASSVDRIAFYPAMQ